VSDAVAVVVLLATCSLTELMFVASTHSATAVPRIQLIAPNCAGDCPESSSVRAPLNQNVQQKPYSARVQGHFIAETSRPIRLNAS
jgi:hypothetical protein